MGPLYQRRSAARARPVAPRSARGGRRGDLHRRCAGDRLDQGADGGPGRRHRERAADAAGRSFHPSLAHAFPHPVVGCPGAAYARAMGRPSFRGGWLATLLAGSLLGLVLVAQPAGAATQRHWGLAVDSYGARLYVCRLPEHTKLGTMWRHYVRGANPSRVRGRATVKVTRWVFRPSHNVVKDKWVRSVPSGASTAVGSVRVWDHRASEGRFADFVDFKVVRP